MSFKFIALFALIAVAAAVEHQYKPAPALLNKQYASEPIYADTPAEYEFNYAIKDEQTGDVKSQQETRKGDNVVGQYSLIDADGYKRIVDYIADEHNGFKAVVRREPISGYKPIIKYVATVPVAHYNHGLTPLTQYNHGSSQVAYSAPTHTYHY